MPNRITPPSVPLGVATVPGTRGTDCGSFQVRDVMLRSVTIRSSGLLRAVGVCNILIVTDSSILFVQMIVCDHVVFSKSQALAHGRNAA